jgi:glyoxylase-like metal-dependent hydrolase (beta-lactamase superfamily II)
MVNAQEAALHYPWGDALPATGTTLELRPGAHWLRMPLPFALNHINLWLLRDRQDGIEGWTVVDCGISDDGTRAAWEQILHSAELQVLPVLRVVCTHMHPDHIGLAHWLCERFACRLWISSTDWNVARIASQSTTGFGGEASAHFFALHGLTDPESLAKVRGRSDYYSRMVPQVPGRFRRLMDGMLIEIGGLSWQCISGYGHAPEHMALHCPDLDLLISGDMVLPRISTNVSVIEMEPEADPLRLYLASIERFRGLPQDTLVLPSHGKPFTGLQTRIDQLHRHHDERLADTLAACSQRPHSAADLLPVLFKRALDLHQTTFAMGESLAHLHALLFQGRLRQALGPDGVLRFSAVPSAAGPTK